MHQTLRVEAGATLMGVARATLYHWPLVYQYARYGDGTTPGWMPHEGSDNATHPNGTHMNGPSLSPFIGSEVSIISVLPLVNYMSLSPFIGSEVLCLSVLALRFSLFCH